MIHVKTRGFTLIELMLAMTFISMLLLAIALTTMQIGNIYNKGITLREVDQAGRAVTDDLQRSVAMTTPFDVTPKTGAPSDLASSRYVKRSYGGRLCIGAYSYVWNYGKDIAAGSALNKYSDGGIVRFAKVLDPSSSLCVNATAAVDRNSASELLANGDRDLVIHNFDIQPGASDGLTSQELYAISLTIGTNDQQQLTTGANSCKPPADSAGNEDYCSVNQFDIIARAGNQMGSK